MKDTMRSECSFCSGSFKLNELFVVRSNFGEVFAACDDCYMLDAMADDVLPEHEFAQIEAEIDCLA